MPKKNKKNQEVKAEETGELYTEKSWAGMPQYCCTLCEFETLKIDVMWDHIAQQHFQEPIPASTMQPLLEPEKQPDEKAVERADGIHEIDLKEDQDGTTNIN